MRQILIVDDEKYICEGMMKIIPWEEYGIDNCLCANSYDEAMKVLTEQSVFLMFTDIKMPEKDGITLLQDAKKMNPELKCVVLSGYDDYQLVRTAMKLGAMDYILKPIPVNELVDVVTSACSDNQFNYGDQEKRLLYRTFEQMITGRIPETLRTSRLEYFGFDPYLGKLGFVLLKTSLSIEDANGIVKQCITKDSIDIKGFAINDGLIGLVLCGREDTSDQEVIEQAQVLFSEMKVCDDAPTYAALSISNEGWDAAGILYQTSMIGMEIASIKKQISLHIEECPTVSSYLLRMSQIRQVLYFKKREELYDYMCGLIPKSDSVEDMKENAIRVLNVLISVILAETTDKDVITALKEKGLTSIESSSDKDSLYREILIVVLMCRNTVLNKTSDEYSAPIKKALEYIQKNYSDDTLCLKTLSAKLNMNAAYLGRLFTTETGELFGDYLSRTRMHYAEKLLLTTDVSISEIATEVGYSSVNQFGRVFKKYLSISPSAMRDSYTKENPEKE